MDPQRTDLIDLLCLHVLADRDLHGYGVYKVLEGYFGPQLTSGKVYSALGRLEQDGLAATRPGEGRRVLYALTSEGEALVSEVRDAPGPLKDAVADLFGIGVPSGARRGAGRAGEGPEAGPWRDVTVHRDLVRGKITITLERGEEGGASPAVERLLRDVLGALLE